MSDIDFSKYPSINFRLGEHLDGALSERGENKNTVAKRDLYRYYDLLACNLPVFTVQEALLLCAALNGVRCAPGTLYANIAASDEWASGKWDVDKPALIERLMRLSYIEAQSVIDAVERAWNTPEYSVNLEQRVLLVGLAK